MADDLDITGARQRVQKKKEESNGGLLILGAFLGTALVGGAVYAATKKGSKPKPKPDVPVPDVPVPDPAPDVPVPDAPPPPAPGELKFDLLNNWGGVPAEWRVDLAKLELASGMPGVARVAAIKAWQAYRAGQPYVSTAEAAAIFAANPDLNREAIAEIDADDAKALLDKNIAQGWPKPKDYDGYARGSFGYFDILGPNIAYAGIHTEPKDKLPFIDLDAVEAGANFQVQADTFVYMIWRILNAPGYKVLVPGPKAADGNSLQTWGNIMSAFAGPVAYMNQTPVAIAAKKKFLERALELGIDLARAAYPWPPGKSYSKAVFDWGAIVKRLQAYKDVPVKHDGAQPVVPPPPPPLDEGLVDVGNGIKARLVAGVGPGEQAPLVVVLHGRGATEEQLLPLVSGSVKKARLAFLRAPKLGQDGYRWFDAMLSDPSPGLDLAIAGATSQVTQAIEALRVIYPQTTEVAVVGYSQGAAIAYRLAASTQDKPAPGVVQRVLAIAGLLPEALRPTGDVTATVYAIHGDQDKTVPVVQGEKTLESFIFKSPAAEFDKVAGGTHALGSLTTAIKARLEK